MALRLLLCLAALGAGCRAGPPPGPSTEPPLQDEADNQENILSQVRGGAEGGCRCYSPRGGWGNPGGPWWGAGWAHGGALGARRGASHGRAVRPPSETRCVLLAALRNSFLGWLLDKQTPSRLCSGSPKHFLQLKEIPGTVRGCSAGLSHRQVPLPVGLFRLPQPCEEAWLGAAGGLRGGCSQKDTKHEGTAGGLHP